MGPATPYPATLNLAGVTGTITRLAVRLNGLAHTYRGDLDMLLVGPGGQRAMFLSDVGNSLDSSGTSLTITFEDGAPAPTAFQIGSGTFAPTDLEPGDVMTAPAPAGPYTSALSVFNGTNPNGAWNLFIMDDAAGDVGTLTSFTLLMATTTGPGDFITNGGVLTFPPGTITQPVTVMVTGDTSVETPETLFVNLSGATSAVIGDSQGMGTIRNDDGTPPTSTADSYSTPFNVPLVVADPGVLSNDTANSGGTLTASVVSPPSHGTLNFVASGGFTYTPTPGFAGTDAFTYRTQSAIGLDSGVATVALTVNQPTEVQPPNEFYVSSVVGNRVTLRWTPAAAGPGAHRLPGPGRRRARRRTRQPAGRTGADSDLRRAERRLLRPRPCGGDERERGVQRGAAVRERPGHPVGRASESVLLQQTLDEVEAATEEARRQLDAGGSLSEITYRARRRVDQAVQSLVLADVSALQADLEEIAAMSPVEVGEAGVPVVTDDAVERMAARDWSPLGAHGVRAGGAGRALRGTDRTRPSRSCRWPPSR